MNTLLDENFSQVYRPLAADFANAVSEINCKDEVLEPFLPLYGPLYETADTRIVFVGIETKGWGSLNGFVTQALQNPESALFRHSDVFDELLFCKEIWGNNFGTGFWDFIFKFLAKFYCIEDWKQLKQGQHPEILQSFAWANTNAVERHHVTAEKHGLSKQQWDIIKTASKPFDRAKHMIDALQPHLMIILSWNTPDEWLTDDTGPIEPVNKIETYLYHYYLSDTNTNVL
ncbi:hypothetical protein [Runella sp.]|uniref:hypothetical protein n=1 Tax=Runella sp. TaxID=1960881 RepID=UPI003D14D56D